MCGRWQGEEGKIGGQDGKKNTCFRSTPTEGAEAAWWRGALQLLTSACGWDFIKAILFNYHAACFPLRVIVLCHYRALQCRQCRSFSNGSLQLVNPIVVNVSVPHQPLFRVQEIWARRQNCSCQKLSWCIPGRCCRLMPGNSVGPPQRDPPMSLSAHHSR